jgi:hypothetical protein
MKKEHALARLKRIGIHYNVLRDDETGVWINTNKPGNKSWKRAMFIKNPVTKLRQCGVCGKISTPKKISYRSLCADWYMESLDEPMQQERNILCTGCWNKVRVIVARQHEANEIRRLNSKLIREYRKCQKSQILVN